MAKVHIVVKPSRQLTVRVTDATKAPIQGAVVGVLDTGLLLAQAETDANGAVSLRLPRDARIDQVVALKPGGGCDYFENYSSRFSDKHTEPPVEVALTLNGARSFHVRVVDTADHGMAGVEVAPWTVRKKDKLTLVNFDLAPELKYASAQRIGTAWSRLNGFRRTCPMPSKPWPPRTITGCSMLRVRISPIRPKRSCYGFSMTSGSAAK